MERSRPGEIGGVVKERRGDCLFMRDLHITLFGSTSWQHFPGCMAVPSSIVLVAELVSLRVACTDGWRVRMKERRKRAFLCIRRLLFWFKTCMYRCE